MIFSQNITANYITIKAFENQNLIGEISIGKEETNDGLILTISRWYVYGNEHLHKGIGKMLLKEAFKAIDNSKIKEIKYIWNGTNGYVGEWLNKFDAKNNCPINLMKYSSEDFPESHIYTLDKEKFLNYIKEI